MTLVPKNRKCSGLNIGYKKKSQMIFAAISLQNNAYVQYIFIPVLFCVHFVTYCCSISINQFCVGGITYVGSASVGTICENQNSKLCSSVSINDNASSHLSSTRSYAEHCVEKYLHDMSFETFTKLFL